MYKFTNNLSIFPLILPRDIVGNIRINSDTENYRSVWRQRYYDITNKNISFEGLDIHYH